MGLHQESFLITSPHINCQFDGGNIVLEQHAADNQQQATESEQPAHENDNHSSTVEFHLKIRQDTNSEFLQWFYFSVSAPQGTDLVLRILNADEASFKMGWQHYQALASCDRQHWLRVSTVYENGQLLIRHRSRSEITWFAYFTPYSDERHLNLIARSQGSPLCKVETLALTSQGRPIVALVIKGDNDQSQQRAVWIIARQHPGETMAEWFIDGMLERLLHQRDPISGSILDKCAMYIVPNMNPDGSVLGNLRTNAAGVNLNREWLSPSPEGSPEVRGVRDRMHETGVFFFLDVHGDEGMPFVFLAGCEGIEGFSDYQRDSGDFFKGAFKGASLDFQTKFGYPKTPAGKANLGIATNYVGKTFACPAFTLEMPFKDNKLMPDRRHGWSAERSQKLGAAILDPILKLLSRD